MVHVGDSRTVLHVSEAFGGGVVAAVRAHVAASPEFRHLLAFSDRLEAPLTGHDLDPFDALVTLPHEPLAAIRTIRRAVRKQHVDIVHAHSAIGGALARLAVRSSDLPIVYTPHCFAHLRLDRSGLSRAAYRAAEKRMASNTTVYAACAPYEYERCKSLGPDVPRVYVPNALTSVDRPPLAGTNDNGRLHILGVGRLFPQKDPEFFAAAVESVRAAGIDLDATWIGDGEAHLRRRLLGADIDVTGWLPREESLRRLAQPGGIYLHSARWEGFPFAILEANAAGLPLIIRHIPTLAAFAFPHEVRDPGDVPLAVKELADPHARAEAVAATDDVLAGNNSELQRSRLLEAYRIALKSVNAPQ
jgi:glycosyltransferase involved in cell wall biosynthesis